VGLGEGRAPSLRVTVLDSASRFAGRNQCKLNFDRQRGCTRQLSIPDFDLQSMRIKQFRILAGGEAQGIAPVIDTILTL
jgi:hypothetical protein